MARPLRIIYQGAVYHITLRGNERKAIFKDDLDRQRFLLKLEESLQRYEVHLHLYCLMTNHVHLVLATPRGNLSRFMQRLQTAYAVYFNRKYKRHGHLWQGRFGASVVEEDEYILKLSRYVHLNPVFTNAVKALSKRERIEVLRAYRWSSYRSYIGKIKPLSFVEEEPILTMLSSSLKQRRSTYRRFVETGIMDIDAAFIENKKRSHLCLGSKGYMEQVKSMYDSLVEGVDNIENVSFRKPSQHCTAQEILVIVCDVMGIEEKVLYRRQRESLTRPLVAQALCTHAGLTQREIAKVLHLNSGASVSHMIKRLAEAIASGDTSLENNLLKIKQQIQKRLNR